MRADITRVSGQWPEDIAPRRGILVLRGYGVDIRVWRGRLRVYDGIGADRREFLIHRATGGLRRLVVIGHTGSITLEAIRWLNDVGASYAQIDADGKLLAAFGGGASYEQPRLRRAQAKAMGEPDGLAITRRLVAGKLDGQTLSLRRLAEHVPVRADALDAIARAREALTDAGEADAIRTLEAGAANAYWSAWSALRLRFAERDVHKVPRHWLTFGSRSSTITGQPRSATNPANAMLNYLYSLVEAEATTAARTVGLDPAIGLFHVDTRFRASLASDLMEPVRPEVDEYLLATITRRTFGARDFFETRTGVCRITPPLASELAATTLHWRPIVGRVAEDVAHALLDAPPWEARSRPITSPRWTRALGTPDGRTAQRSIDRRCGVCGKPVPRRQDRVCSPECLEQSRISHGHAAAAKGQARLNELRAEGRDPTQSPAARAKQSTSAARRRAEQRAWDETNPVRPDRELYEREIAPHLRGVSIYRIRRATGLSTAQAWRIRDGRVVPHPRWWEILRSLVGT